MTGAADLRLMAIADSDSYLKWAAGTIGSLPTTWPTQLVVLRSPLTPSPDQMRSALPSGAPQPALVGPRRLRTLVREMAPDLVLVACTGPVADLVPDLVARVSKQRPGLAAGLPGMALHDDGTAWRNRAGADLLVVHSHAEVAAVREHCERLGLPATVALTHLPFLDPAPMSPGPGTPERSTVVFAPQALVPAGRRQREQVLSALADCASEQGRRVIVKLRGRRDEQQTHREAWDYESLWADLVARGTVDRTAVEFVTGDMADHLRGAAGLATVGSTAALEAMAAGVPVLVLGDFGVGPRTFNGVFDGSGCIGTLDDLRAGRFRGPDPRWATENYFHPRDDDDLMVRLHELAREARAGELGPPARSAAGALARLRSRARLALPRPAVGAARRLTAARRRSG